MHSGDRAGHASTVERGALLPGFRLEAPELPSFLGASTAPPATQGDQMFARRPIFAPSAPSAAAPAPTRSGFSHADMYAPAAPASSAPAVSPHLDPFAGLPAAGPLLTEQDHEQDLGWPDVPVAPDTPLPPVPVQALPGSDRTAEMIRASVVYMLMASAVFASLAFALR